MNHPFIVSARFSFETDQKLFLLMDFVSGGNLLDRLQAQNCLTEDAARLNAGEPILVIGHTHGNGFI
jgi:serine/threonine protein kinase